ncbi:MAG: putative 2-aminoethylphosphonate ABC transporter permease subunit [Methylobacterium sp.]|nr:putative 2-aminoethylphosphonate ABC transporter permease subunit [Methylobacterium sp.]MCA3659844.1 putative 2-aminoethylphosphonate ABC transporter permease subunit [Methylobacterium sp.]MCA3662282.1 putative 2-aminoethylphosphonate ABC transporter permease subunit [Methylobacterium sp.]MCA3668208.1 putative 2-aminoethylphosphonate ABC transporter permease subunit [Methylobacterium sp.]MCA3670917.1 putative 2-aminoethylphosphonate ABC transporter permease subunit [Methylobacterium sp.]
MSANSAFLTRDREAWVATALLAGLAFVLVLLIAVPLWSLLSKSVQNSNGQFVGLANFARYIATPALVVSLWNSIWVSGLVALIVVPLAFLYAYALTRSRMPGRGLFMAVAMTPLFAPSLLSAISLIYIFGNQGFLKSWLFGASIYGPVGIVLAEAVYCFPHALMILVTALRLADGRLYEVAEALDTSKSRVFFTVTLPGARYGLISAIFVVFTLVITDFGIPKVIGGQFNVLATDAYKQIVGQQNFEMGAVVGLILLLPAIFAFLVDRQVQKKQVALLSARAVPYEPKANARRDFILLAFCLVIGGLLIGMLGTAIWASFIRYWPYNLTFTLNNYNFANFDPQGWGAYLTSLKMAGLTAIFGTAIVFTGAYLVEKTKPAPALRGFVHFLAMLPMAVPGLVLGLGYVFFVNAPWNPLNIFYGTLTVLVANTVAHFYTVAHITAVTQLKQIDAEFESVSASLKVPFWMTFRRVTLPISTPAVLDIAVYLFVNALTTVSAVIFLYGPTTKLASIAIVHMDEMGAVAAAAAMATCIVFTAMAVKLLHLALDRLVFARYQAWRKR